MAAAVSTAEEGMQTPVYTRMVFSLCKLLMVAVATVATRWVRDALFLEVGSLRPCPYLWYIS